MKAARLLVVYSLLLAGAAHAQIYKCKDERGQLLLSDKPCASGELLQRKSTDQERAQDDMRAYEANVNKQNRRAREQAREMSSAQYRQQPSLQSAGATSGADSAECKTAQRDLEFASSSIARNEAEKRSNVNAAIARVNAACGSNTELMQPPPRLPAPPVVTCNVGGCTDNYGGVYNKVSPDYMTGPNGRTCHRSGTMWNCN